MKRKYIIGANKLKKLMHGLSQMVRTNPLTNRVDMIDIARVSGVSPRTAYRLGTPDDLVQVYKQYVLDVTKKLYSTYQKFGIKILLRKLLELVEDHRDYFSMYLVETIDQPFTDILTIISDTLFADDLPEEQREVFFYQFVNDFIFAVRNWSEEHYSSRKLSKYVDGLVGSLNDLHRTTLHYQQISKGKT